ncbi:MAG: lysophospholipid acyltransferase family protein [Sandaracinaceae bacterium]|nr:lysophospholipid acyltransferase family protein [Sandaracinaceae bacterium]
MPRWLRIILTGFCFFLFFCGSPLIPILFFPYLRLTSKNQAVFRERTTCFINRALYGFTRILALFGLIRAPAKVSLPAGVDPSRPFVLISNHPTLIDVVLTLGWFERLTCVVKGHWKRSWALGTLLHATNHLFGPSGEGESTHRAIVEHLRRGHPILIYPEGTRSLADRLHRFRRGAVEAAFEAGVPIVPMYLEVSEPLLMKGVPFWKVPVSTPEFRVEFFEVIDPRKEHRTPKEVNAYLQSRYRSRFAKTIEDRGHNQQKLKGGGCSVQNWFVESKASQ